MSSEFDEHYVSYSDFVASRVKNPEDIIETLDTEKVDLIHASFGLAGEVGELVDAVKKHFAYNKPLDIVNIREELGDIEFYLEHFRSVLDIDRDEIIQENIDKLTKRYASGYTDQQASDRNDKKNAE